MFQEINKVIYNFHIFHFTTPEKLILGTFKTTLVHLIIGLNDLICDRSKRNFYCKWDFSGGLLTQGERSPAHA